MLLRNTAQHVNMHFNVLLHSKNPKIMHGINRILPRFLLATAGDVLRLLDLFRSSASSSPSMAGSVNKFYEK